MAETFAYPLKVRFQYCDPAGIVFYPRYFEMINEAVEVWFDERIGVSFEALRRDLGGSTPTARIEVAFNAPSRHGDALVFRLAPTRMGRSSLDLSLEAVCAGETRLRMTSTLVYVAGPAMRPAPWPEPVARVLRAILAAP